MTEECCKTNIFASATDTLRRVTQDSSRVSEEVKQQRLSICAQCPHFNPTLRQCRACGCLLDIKCSFANMRCPHGLWIEHTLAN